MTRGGNEMNRYVKQMLDSRIEYLEMIERETEQHIGHLEKSLSEKKDELKKVREEKRALKEE
jgi:uncharacterized coiled-coil protein SlyX